METLRHIIGFQSRRVEPFLKRVGLATMAERVPEPNALQRRDLVESGASTRFERKIRVGAHADVQNIVSLTKIVGNFESKRRREFVVRVERWRVAIRAGLLLKDHLTFSCVVVELVRIRRRLQRVDVESQRVELSVAVARSFFGAEACRVRLG